MHYLVQLSLLVMQQLKNVLQEGEETHELALWQGTLDPMEGENCVLYVPWILWKERFVCYTYMHVNMLYNVLPHMYMYTNHIYLK